MNKKLITVAVAAALAAPAAAMAEATIYGTIAAQVTYEDVKSVFPRTIEQTTVLVNEGDAPIGYSADGSAVYASPGDIPRSVTGYQLDANGRPIPVTSGRDFKGWGVNQSSLLKSR